MCRVRCTPLHGRLHAPLALAAPNGEAFQYKKEIAKLPATQRTSTMSSPVYERGTHENGNEQMGHRKVTLLMRSAGISFLVQVVCSL